ncbi:MAG: ArsR/SmtB family transcription factor [Candidatus Heimdallarchaeota archaeon]
MVDDTLSEIELILKILSFKIENRGFLDVEEIDEILHLLANGTRRRMLAELAAGEGFVNELVRRLDDHPQSIIRHLEVLKKHNLIKGEERRDRPSRRGRPRLYYSVAPDVAAFIRRTKGESTSQYRLRCSSFPRLNTLQKLLDEKALSHSEQKKVLKEVKSIKKEHEIAISVCDEILEKTKKKVTKIEIQ